jgi:2-phospho-L-lactate guanylyltransferase
VPVSAAFAPWAVLPAKRFGRAKTRLDPALASHQRRALATGLLERVLDACRESRALRGVLVATDGDDVAALALGRGASVLRDAEAPPASLARVVDAALHSLRARGATHALVLMSDLPQVQARDVHELLAAMRQADVVLCPDAQRRGTSALGLRLTPDFRSAFGHPDSLVRHLREAARLGLRARVLCNPRVALDVDVPRDLARLVR